MKRRNFLKKAGMGTAAVAATTVNAPFVHAASKKVYKFKFQGVTPRGTIPSDLLYLQADWLRKMSNGRLDITVFDPDTLVPSKELLEACGHGFVEMFFISQAWWAGLEPAVNVQLVPMGPRTQGEASNFYHDTGFKKILNGFFHKHNVHAIDIVNPTGYTLISKVPIRSINDFKGLKVRSLGLLAKMFANLGASVVSIPGSEIYTATSTGVIDAFHYGGPMAEAEMKFYEVTKYMMQPNILSVDSCPVCINLKTWNKFPDDLKVMLETAIGASSQWYHRKLFAGDKVSSRKWKVITLPESDVAKITEAAMKTWDELAQQSTAAKEGIKLLKDYMRLMGHVT